MFYELTAECTKRINRFYSCKGIFERVNISLFLNVCERIKRFNHTNLNTRTCNSLLLRLYNLVRFRKLKQRKITIITTGKKTKQARNQCETYVCVLITLTVTVYGR